MNTGCLGVTRRWRRGCPGPRVAVTPTPGPGPTPSPPRLIHTSTSSLSAHPDVYDAGPPGAVFNHLGEARSSRVARQRKGDVYHSCTHPRPPPPTRVHVAPHFNLPQRDNGPVRGRGLQGTTPSMCYLIIVIRCV